MNLQKLNTVNKPPCPAVGLLSDDLPDPDNLKPEELPSLLADCDKATDLIERIRQSAKEAIRGGRTVCGWRIQIINRHTVIDHEAARIRKQQTAEAEQLAERRRLLAEKEKADKDAAQVTEDARRLARRTDVGSCRQAIMQASFDEYDAGTFATVWSDYNEETVMAAVVKLPTAWADKVVACMKNNAWMFDD